jgi:hypothetical protein
VQQLVRERGRQPSSNILVFVLDHTGRYVHSFDGMTDRHPAPMGDLKKRMPGYFVQELERAARTMGFTKTTAAAKTRHLPTTTEPGLRLYLTLGENRMQHFAVPVVEAVTYGDAEKGTLRYRSEAYTLEATALQRWFAPIYPPAVMDGHGGMERVSGTLSVTPAGSSTTHRYAIVKGTFRFQLDNTSRITYAGPVELLCRYPKDSVELDAVWGVLKTSIPRHNQQGRTVETVSLTVAIEPVGSEAGLTSPLSGTGTSRGPGGGP